MRALLLAAGEGTRLRPLTDQMPKPMVPVAGRPILEHNVQLLAQHGIREIAMNLHHCPEVVKNHFGDGSRFGVHITYSFEPVLLGTAGAVKELESFLVGAKHSPTNQADPMAEMNASPLRLHQPFLVLYGDNLIQCDLTRLVNFHRRQHGIMSMALFQRDDVTQSGIVALDEHERITRFIEKPKPDQVFSHWVSAGLLVVAPEIMQWIPTGAPTDFGRELLPQLLAADQKLYGYRMSADENLWWIDTPTDLARVQNIFNEAARS